MKFVPSIIALASSLSVRLYRRQSPAVTPKGRSLEAERRLPAEINVKNIEIDEQQAANISCRYLVFCDTMRLCPKEASAIAAPSLLLHANVIPRR